MTVDWYLFPLLAFRKTISIIPGYNYYGTCHHKAVLYNMYMNMSYRVSPFLNRMYNTKNNNIRRQFCQQKLISAESGPQPICPVRQYVEADSRQNKDKLSIGAKQLTYRGTHNQANKKADRKTDR